MKQALLQTERLRIEGSILFISTFVITGAIRIYLFGSHLSHIGLYCAVVFIGYEGLVLRAVQRNIRSEISIPDWFWTTNVVIEMFMPALAVAFLASDRILPDYRPRVTSWVLLFFPFLVLSTLRLSAVVSSVAGLAGALGYLLAAGYNGWHIKANLQSNPITHSAVPFEPFELATMRDFPERWRAKLCALLAEIVTLERAVNLICDGYFDGHDVLFKDSRGELTSCYEVAQLLVAGYNCSFPNRFDNRSEVLENLRIDITCRANPEANVWNQAISLIDRMMSVMARCFTS